MDVLIQTYYIDICLAKLIAINELYVRNCEITKKLRSEQLIFE